MPIIGGRRTEQSNISTGGGNVTAGDSNTTNIFNTISQKSRTPLSEACEILQAGVAQDKGKQQFIRRLLDFMGETDDSAQSLRSLEDKMREGGMSDRSERAARLKERFAKKLVASTFNSLLQEVYALILVELDSGYEHKIRPLLRGSDHAVIMGATHDLFCAIEAQMANYREITKDDLEGMLYYLAGKCFIDWRKP